MPSLVEIMACHLIEDNPLSQPIIVYCQLDHKEHISMKFYLKFKRFHSRKCISRCRLQKWQPSWLSLYVLNSYRLLKVQSHMRGADAGGELASTQIITCVHTYAVAERRRSGSKIRSATNASNTQFSTSASKLHAPNHLCPQEMADSLRLCVNILW